MKEKRIYIVSTTNADGDEYALNLWEIEEMTDEDFIEEAEGQGWVWSSVETFARYWNDDCRLIPSREDSVMRVIEVNIND